MKTWLIDTGPLVAYLDAAEPLHERVTAVFDGFGGRLATTGAVVTEAMHLVSVDPDGPRLLVDLIGASGLQVYDLCKPPELREAVKLMERYRDTPMDFADATLVLLAEGLEVHDILTLDRRGFAAYRTRRRQGFRLLLDSL